MALFFLTINASFSQTNPRTLSPRSSGSSDTVTRNLLPTGRGLPDTLPADEFIYVSPLEGEGSSVNQSLSLIPESVPEPSIWPSEELKSTDFMDGSPSSGFPSAGSPSFDPIDDSLSNIDNPSNIFAEGVDNPPGSVALDNPPESRAVGSPPDSKAVSSPPDSRAVENPPGSGVVENPPGSGIDVLPGAAIAETPKLIPNISPELNPSVDESTPSSLPGPLANIGNDPNSNPPPEDLVVMGPVSDPSRMPGGEIPPKNLELSPDSEIENQPTQTAEPFSRMWTIGPSVAKYPPKSEEKKEEAVKEVAVVQQPPIKAEEKSTDEQVIKSLNGQRYIQIASYKNYTQASSKVSEMKLAVGRTLPNDKITIYKNNNTMYYRVIVGPFQASEIGIQMYHVRAKGYKDAFILK